MNALETVIYTLETYDPLTIRIAVPLYLLCGYISGNTDNVLIMTGEGADELAQGYLYFHKQPTAKDGDIESRRQLMQLYLYDVLRIDRCTAAHGLEIRAPFLDHAFTSYYLSLPADLRAPKNGIEKHLIRAAFEGTNLIPANILWRQKVGFSDGVATLARPWYHFLQEDISKQVSDECLADASTTYPHNTPRSKEEFYYRQIFENKFGSHFSYLTQYQRKPNWASKVKK
uniref:asparagine synthetase [glutamine-hydrolyzing]-like n=1 Tax=Ciona intestinalis TaxID=7719 RepID=UPI000EF49E73|nr:asparagine synthetase [glutamine-hydrolyzing]-like [Ciona intestinalis]|eukprot:XP_018672851.2 asparagine synthetase [glutamine-hydrolyzing]-like [Ciona intestinalis]